VGSRHPASPKIEVRNHEGIQSKQRAGRPAYAGWTAGQFRVAVERDEGGKMKIFRMACAALLIGGAAAGARAADLSPKSLASIGSSTSPTFSPDGATIAFVSNASGLPQIWTVSSHGGEPKQLTHLADPVQSVHWSPKGDWLAYDVAPGGGLNVQVYAIHPDGMGVKLLTAGGQVNNRLFGWTHDGAEVQVATNKDDVSRFDAFLVNPTSGTARPVGQKTSLTSITDVSRDGRFAIVSRLVARGDDNLFLVDLATNSETLLTPHNPPAEFGWGVFSPDGRRVYLIGNGATDFAVFGVIDLDSTRKPGPMRVIAARKDAEAEGAVLSNDGRTAKLAWNVAGRTELASLDTKTMRLSAGPRVAPELKRPVEFDQTGKRLALVALGAAAPADIWIANSGQVSAQQITHSPHVGVDLAQLATPKLIRYPAHDGVPLSGWLYRPSSAKGPGPVVFIYHGGPEGQSRPTLSGDVQSLVASGISVFLPNVRGSTGYGKRFMNLDNGALRVNGVHDIKSTTDALVKLGVADPKRLGIMGGSYGGYMVMAGVTEYPDMFAAGADLYGVVNFDTFFKHTQPWMAAISKVKYGDPDTQAKMLFDLSPINKLDRVKTPLIVLHGANDTNVPVVEAEQIVTKLKQRGIPVEYVLFPGEGHGFRRLENRIKATEATTRFFKSHLTDESNHF
jgi:dipeptidyl aminopeptidase/acylaminoacyl peptidase